MTSELRNALSVDLEDWFCVANLRDAIPPERWDACELRVVESTSRLLALFERRGVRATFFVLGWIADRAPALVRDIARRGHEICTHGYAHLLATTVTPDEFERDLARSLETLRPLSAEPVRGYRAPSFTITKRTLWAIGILARHGIRYDSSVFPTSWHPDYGIADAPLLPYTIAEGVTEVPLSVVPFGPLRVPAAGGGYFRLYPYRLTRALLARLNRRGVPAVFYLHPWEADPGQPRVRLPLTKRFRHYVNLDRTETRLARLLDDFRFAPIREVFAL